MQSAIGKGLPDLETVEEALDVSVAVFSRFKKHESARTALGALGADADGRASGLKNDYSSLRPDDRRRCEAALGTAAVERIAASEVFEALASALDEGTRDQDAGSRITALIVDYVAAVVRAWHSAGLRPSRAHHPDRPEYTSKFRGFADLVLSAFLEPAARRGDDDLHEIQQKTWRSHAKLPDNLRRLVSSALPRRDLEWLVSDDHVKQALRRVQKTAPQTP
jgi:hypothetical protein